GYDLVYGRRAKLTGPMYRRVGTRAANFLLRHLTAVPMGDVASNFIALNQRLVRQSGLFHDHSRFLKSLLAWLSYGRCCEVEVVNRERQYGVSKYTFWQLVRIVLGVIVSLSVRPLALTSYAGAGLVFLGALMAARWTALVIHGGWAANETTLFAALVLFAGGIQLLALGVLGEYIGRIYGEVRERPPYVISEVYGNPERPRT
ncbi:MAG: hypothetical protein HZB26_07620, partial [Candidatus Hydrogenedentes bacterium]|nr:hypothetical protein [Candidatus Hydrogenedentota bacterium]